MEKLVLYRPVRPSSVNQSFGECLPSLCSKYKELGLEGHNGIDYWAPDGHEVRAAHDGLVTFSGEDGSGGLGVVIRTNVEHPYKDGDVYFKTIYWHLKAGSIRVLAGQKVTAGDVIALADNTGLSTGSQSMTYNESPAEGFAAGMVSFAPAVAAGPTTVKTWDGITQSTGIKTYFGVDLANVKTVDGAS